jgi:hypothetical protein
LPKIFISYSYLLSIKIAELVIRLVLLGLLIRKFDTIIYGSISYNLAIAQGLAALIFGASIQAIPLLPTEERITYLKVYSILCAILTIIGGIIWGPIILVFSFYGLINLLTGWGISTEKQLSISLLRALSFLPPALYLILQSNNTITESAFYFCFGISTSFLLLNFPFSKLLNTNNRFDFKLSTGYQLHSAFFQSSKLLERQVFISILNPLQFGYYSMFRDITNGINFTLFSSWYQLVFIKLSKEATQKRIKLSSYILKCIAASILIGTCTYICGPALRIIILYVLNKPFEVSTIVLLSLIAYFDFLKGMNFARLEAAKKIRKLFLVDIADITLVLALGLIPLLTELIDIHDTALVLLMRITVSVIITIFGLGSL